MESKSTKSDRKESSDENLISMFLDLTNSMTSMAVYVSTKREQRDLSQSTEARSLKHVEMMPAHLEDISHILSVGVFPQER